MKKIAILALAFILLLVLMVTPVMAKGPIEAGEMGVPHYVPCNENAWPYILTCIMPHYVLLGTETTIVEDGITIVVSAIPTAEWNEATETWEGPFIQLSWSRAWEAATYPLSPYYTGEWKKQAWADYKFWLNGYGPITITRNGEVEDVTEFIFFRVKWVGNGNGNSDFDVGHNFDVTIVAYQ